jgi:5'-methylthioadenosine phosphorylase
VSEAQDGVRAEVGVIGGSGLYQLLDNATEVAVSTPYGDPSDPITVADVDGRRVVFLPRHGRDHRYPPHKIPYRANLWALRSIGVRQIIAPCAVGGLRADLGPGRFVVPDQLIDRTSGRPQTFHDSGAVHVNFAEPYCPVGRATVLAAARPLGAIDGGTMVVVEGPRFSTRAESQWFARQGWTLVNMTGHPEAVLARELELCYAPIALVTDLDAGLAEGEGVSAAEVFAEFKRNLGPFKELVRTAIENVTGEDTCAECRVHDGVTLPFELP